MAYGLVHQQDTSDPTWIQVRVHHLDLPLLALFEPGGKIALHFQNLSLLQITIPLLIVVFM